MQNKKDKIEKKSELKSFFAVIKRETEKKSEFTEQKKLELEDKKLTLEIENNKLEEDNRQLEKEINKLKEEEIKFKKSKKLLEEEVKKSKKLFEEEKARLEEEKAKLEKEKARLEAKLEEEKAKFENEKTKLEKRIMCLEEELRGLKKLKEKPKINPSTLNNKVNDQIKSLLEGEKKRPGSDKHSKKNITIHEERVLEPKNIPEGAVFIRSREFDVQELNIESHNIRFKIQEYKLPNGEIISGELPEKYDGHFGPTLKSYIINQHYACGVPQHLIVENTREFGIDISEGQINVILTEDKETFIEEINNVLKVGLEHSPYVHTDDTGARHAGKNCSCNVIGNDVFTYFFTSNSKSRENFLNILRGSSTEYILNEDAKNYLYSSLIKEQKIIQQIQFADDLTFNNFEEFEKYIVTLEIKNQVILKNIKESAIFASAIRNGLNPNIVILSDGAPQFNIHIHALCWIHVERLIRKLSPTNSQEIENINKIRSELWDYYQKLKDYKINPNDEYASLLSKQFDEIFSQRFENHDALNKVMIKFEEKKEQLLIVLTNIFVPLHNNGAENDIREYVTRRKRSGGTRSEIGKQVLDTMLGLKKTCRKLEISFWDYLKSRIYKTTKIPQLAEIIKNKLGVTAIAVV